MVSMDFSTPFERDGTMAEPQKPMKRHMLTLEGREKLAATGITRVDFFSEELITAQTELGQLNLKGQGLHIDTLNAETGDMLVLGKVTALSYTERDPARSVLGRLFK